MSPGVHAHLALVLGVDLDPGGTNPGPASKMSYRLRINFADRIEEGPGGLHLIRGVVRDVAGVRPVCGRWPDNVSDVRAIPTNTAVWVAEVNGVLQLMHAEAPDAAPCPQGGF